MNPFESARLEAASLRAELQQKGIDLSVGGFELVAAACKALDVALRTVKPNFHLLKSADATIIVRRKWSLVRNDVHDDIKAFLVAHELGHLRLHPTTSGSVEVSQDALGPQSDTTGARQVESYGARERQELQANVFAREFLLPRDQARKAFVEQGLSASSIAIDRQLPLELVRLQVYDAVLLPSIERPSKLFRLPDRPTEAQTPAVESDAEVSLIEAGPGTGKTTTLLLRLRRLVASGVSPDTIVILTFSNKAARELVERARAGNIPGADRVWIGTFHAFGLEFLRKFGHLYGLESRFPVLEKLATLAMLETDVTSADLKVFDPLSNPSPWLENVVDAIRRSKDEVFDATKFSAAVTASSSGEAELDGKRQDVAHIFERYEVLLARRQAVDLTDLLCVPIRLMQVADPAVVRFLRGIHHLMVDEYQDVNRASALMVKELSRHSRTLWVVGDANQAIYAFMGASSTNLEKFQEDFPSAVSIPLEMNHRSSQEIVSAFGSVASRNPASRQTIALVAARGKVGHGPRHIQTADRAEQVQALAWRIHQLENEGTLLAEQAIIVYRNADAADIASSLEELGVPVLFLGNIFERPEVKDLICLLQLAVDSYGVNLVRQWHSPLLGLSRQGADTIFDQTRSQEVPWQEVSGDGLNPKDRAAWQHLGRQCSLVEASMAPWEALSKVLLDDGAWLRDLATREGQAAANALMAVWQFVHFCRSPDGTGRWSTVKNLPQRIRDRVRLGEDRSMRAVPPEAEGMNAVRVLTAHGSKGLEFDAVHFLGVTRNTYETPRYQPNKLIPDDVLEAAKGLDVLKNERHNLLYVAISRPRYFLTVYSNSGDELPAALNGLFARLDGPWGRSQAPSVEAVPRSPPSTEVPLDEYLQFIKCPQRTEMSRRAGRSQREDLKIYRAVDLATWRAMDAMAANPALLDDASWRPVVSEALSSFGLDQHDAAATIRQRVEERANRGRRLLRQGGTGQPPLSMSWGPLKVNLKPDQVLTDGLVRVLRFIRPNAKSLASLKQPLAALLDSHHRSGGQKTTIEVATLSDGAVSPIGTIQARTRPKYDAIAAGLCARQFPTTPEGPRTCHFCAYMFPCSKRVPDEE